MNDKKLKLLLVIGFVLMLVAVANYVMRKTPEPSSATSSSFDPNAGISAGGSVDGKQMPPNHDKLIEAQKLRDHLKDNPTDTEHWTQLGNLLFDSGQFEEATNAYKTSLEQKPGNNDVRTDYAVCLFNTGQTPAAIRELERVVQSDPKHLTALFNLGIMNLHANRTDEAKKYWNRVIATDPTSDMAKKAQESIAKLSVGQ